MKLSTMAYCAAVLMTNSGLSASVHTIYVDAAASGLNDGSSWVNAYSDLQQAVADAQILLNDGSSVTEVFVYVAEGVYRPHSSNRAVAFELPLGIRIQGGYPSGGVGTRSVYPSATVLSGDINVANVDTDNSETVVRLVNSTKGSMISIDGVQIAYGNNVDSTSTALGAGVDGTLAQTDPDAILVLKDCWIRENKGKRGAGIRVAAAGILLQDVSITSNTTYALPSFPNIGGAIYLEGDVRLTSNCIPVDRGFSSNIIADNVTVGGHAAIGAIVGVAQISNYSFTRNTIEGFAVCPDSTSTSGLLVEQSGSGSNGVLAPTPFVINCRFIANGVSSNPSVFNTAGVGALVLQTPPPEPNQYADGARTIRIVNCLFAENRGWANSAVYLTSKSAAHFFYCTFANDQTATSCDEDGVQAAVGLTDAGTFYADVCGEQGTWFVASIFADYPSVRLRGSAGLQVGIDPVVRMERCRLPAAESALVFLDCSLNGTEPNTFGDPVLLADYSLCSSSPCIDAGTVASLGEAQDFADLDIDTSITEDLPRDIQLDHRSIPGPSAGSALPDVGAFEWHCVADIADSAGEPGGDGLVNEGDYNFFFNTFFLSDTCLLRFVDIADNFGNAPPSGENSGLSEGDYNAFFNFFFGTCFPSCP